MMSTTVVRPASSPVISLLSSGKSTSHRAHDVLMKLFSLQPIRPQHKDQEVSGIGSAWESVSSRCPSSGSIINIVSKKSTVNEQSGDSLSLLAVTEGNDAGPCHAVIESIRKISAHERQYGQAWKLSLVRAIGRPVKSSHILGTQLSSGGLPLMSLPQSQTEKDDTTTVKPLHGLKELCLPHYEDCTYHDGSTLLSRLAASPDLERPVAGLFKWNNLTIRPLPAATEDRSLPPPCLVFSCEDLSSAEQHLTENGATFHKIGYTGSKAGQLIVQHEAIHGLELRLCPSMGYSSCFAEAQHALLAASIKELQSNRVMMEGGEKHGKDSEQNDEQIGDCWTEFRATMKQPVGFFKSKSRPIVRPKRAAKTPDIPYE